MGKECALAGLAEVARYAVELAAVVCATVAVRTYASERRAAEDPGGRLPAKFPRRTGDHVLC